MYHFIRRFFQYKVKIEPPWLAAILISFLVFTALAVILYKKEKITTRQGVGGVLLLTYLLSVVSSTVFCRPESADYQFSFQLLWKYGSLLAGNTQYLSEILVNIIMFAVTGFLLRFTFDKLSLKSLFLLAVVCSLSIELLQFVTRRGFAELNDVFNNTIGAGIGFAAFSITQRKKQ